MLDRNLSYKYNNTLKVQIRSPLSETYKLTQNYDRLAWIKAKEWLTNFECKGTIAVKRVTKSYFEKADKKTRSQEFIIFTVYMPKGMEQEFNTTIPELKMIEVRDGYEIKVRYSGSRITKTILAKNFFAWCEFINSLKLNHDLYLLQNK